MIGLKNKGLNNKLVLSTCLMILNLSACNLNSEKQSVSQVGLLNSPTYKEYLNSYEDKEKVQDYDRKFFNLIGEEAFLNAETYDFYAVYLTQTIENRSMVLYILKQKSGISIATLDKVSNSDFMTFATFQNDLDIVIHRDVFSRIVKDAEIQKFKKKISLALPQIEERVPEDNHSLFRLLFYFDGNNYYRLSNQQISEEQMSGIDTLFRNAKIFME